MFNQPSMEFTKVYSNILIIGYFKDYIRKDSFMESFIEVFEVHNLDSSYD